MQKKMPRGHSRGSQPLPPGSGAAVPARPALSHLPCGGERSEVTW